jgi:hypothetical protein
MIALNQSLYLLQGAGYESIHRSENYLIAMRPVSHLMNMGGAVKIIVRNFAGTKFYWYDGLSDVLHSYACREA